MFERLSNVDVLIGIFCLQKGFSYLENISPAFDGVFFGIGDLTTAEVRERVLLLRNTFISEGDKRGLAFPH